MKANWVAFAAVAAFASVPAVAQDVDVTAPPTGTTTTTTTAPAMNYTNVDLSAMRNEMNTLRDYLGRIQTNSTLGNAAVDIVHQDAYRRLNQVLVDDAYAVGLNLLDTLGPATQIPPGLGAPRDYIEQAVDHIRHARLVGSYNEPIDDASTALKNAFEALNTANVAMVGVTVTPGMTQPGMTQPMTQPGMTQPMTQPGMTQPGTTESGATPSSTGEPTKNQANPAISDYNRQNNAGTGVGATTPVPNNTPGQPGTGNTDTGTTNETNPPQ